MGKSKAGTMSSKELRVTLPDVGVVDTPPVLNVAGKELQVDWRSVFKGTNSVFVPCVNINEGIEYIAKVEAYYDLRLTAYNIPYNGMSGLWVCEI